jgi:hypothetical protein
MGIIMTSIQRRALTFSKKEKKHATFIKVLLEQKHCYRAKDKSALKLSERAI